MELYVLRSIADGVTSLAELERMHPVLGRQLQGFVDIIDDSCEKAYRRFSNSLDSVLTLPNRPTKAEKEAAFETLRDASNSEWFRDVAGICDDLGALADSYEAQLHSIADHSQRSRPKDAQSILALLGILNKHEQSLKHEIRNSVSLLKYNISNDEIEKAKSNALSINEGIGLNLLRIRATARRIEGTTSRGADAILSRRTKIGQGADDEGAISILFFASNPKGTHPLRLDEEVREIDDGLRRARYRDRFKLKQKWAVRAEDLRRGLLDEQPAIVHFSGHGSPTEGLICENAHGDAEAVSSRALSELFSLFTSCVNCVILNACYSAQQAEAIAKNVPYVIGMSKAIGDEAAIKFAVGFYDALGAGRSYEDAFAFGCNAIDLSRIPEHQTPQLKKRVS